MIRIVCAAFSVIMLILLEGVGSPAKAQDLPLCGQWVVLRCGIDHVPALKVCGTNHHIIPDPLADGNWYFDSPYTQIDAVWSGSVSGQYWRLTSLEKLDGNSYKDWCTDYSVEPGFITSFWGEVVDSCAACQPPTPTPPVEISGFAAMRPVIYPGECTSLRWTIYNAVWVNVDGRDVESRSSMDVCPVESADFVLRARAGDGSEVSSTTHIEVQPFPEASIEYWSDSTNIQTGQCTVLHWRVSNVKEIYLNEEGVTGEGSREVCPTTPTNYRLRIVKHDGEDARDITIEVSQPEVSIEYSVDNDTINAGDCTTLRWDTRNASEVYLDGSQVALSGTQQVCPTSSRDYQLRSITPRGEDNRGRHVEVIPGNQPEPTATPQPDSRDDAQIADASDDITLKPGESYLIRFVFRNTGNSTWGDGYGFKTSGRWANFAPPYLCGSVGPNSTCEMSLNSNAPNDTGTYEYGLRMQHNGAEFGESRIVRITVVGADVPSRDSVTVRIPKGINLRSGPGTDYKPPLATTSSSSTYDVRGKNNGWYLACCYRDEEFWVSNRASGVNVTGDLARVPSVPAPARGNTNRALQAKLKFLQNHSNCFDGSNDDGCGYDWKFSTLEVRGVNQNDDFVTWPSQGINCKPYADQVIGATGLCEAELLTRDYWWVEGGTIDIEYGAVPVSNMGRMGLPISEPTKYGSCTVAVPARYWPFEREFEVIINPDTQECTPKN